MFKFMITDGKHHATTNVQSAWAAQILAKRYARAYQVTVTKDGEPVFANFFDDETIGRYGFNFFERYIDAPIIEEK